VERERSTSCRLLAWTVFLALEGAIFVLWDLLNLIPGFGFAIENFLGGPVWVYKILLYVPIRGILFALLTCGLEDKAWVRIIGQDDSEEQKVLWILRGKVVKDGWVTFGCKTVECPFYLQDGQPETTPVWNYSFESSMFGNNHQALTDTEGLRIFEVVKPGLCRSIGDVCTGRKVLMQARSTISNHLVTICAPKWMKYNAKTGLSMSFEEDAKLKVSADPLTKEDKGAFELRGYVRRPLDFMKKVFLDAGSKKDEELTALKYEPNEMQKEREAEKNHLKPVAVTKCTLPKMTTPFTKLQILTMLLAFIEDEYPM